MTNKQIFAVVGGVAAVVAVCAFVYQQFTISSSKQQTNSMIRSEDQTMKPSDKTGNRRQVMVPVPDTIDGIAADIESETTLDMLALDEEVAGETSIFNEDSASINNLGTSYDESNL